MADDNVGMPDEGPGPKVDTESLLVAAVTVHRERHQFAGKADTEIAEVRNTDPTPGDHGLVVRDAGPISSKVDFLTRANVAQGSTINLNGTDVAAGKTGKLFKVTVSATIPCRWQIMTRAGIALVTHAVIFTGGMGNNPTKQWQPLSKEGVTRPHVDGDERFGVRVVSLTGSPTILGGVYATIEWDEV